MISIMILFKDIKLFGQSDSYYVLQVIYIYIFRKRTRGTHKRERDRERERTKEEQQKEIEEIATRSYKGRQIDILI